MTKEKWVFVTAGEKGIGAGIVRLLASEGYRVIFTFRTDSEAARQLIRDIETRGSSAESCYCDVRNAMEIKILAKALIAKHGAPYGVIYNAGICLNKPLVNITLDEWHETIDTNLNGLFYITHAFLSSMMARDDSCVITIGSISGLRGNPGQTAYSASKAAHEGFVKSLAREVGPFNVRVNCVAPGPIGTRMLDGISDKKKSGLISQTPLRRLGESTDIAHAVRFLLGHSGQHITGQTLVIDGGLTV